MIASRLENISIPDAANSEPKEVYAFFGLCSYYAQVLEKGVVNLVVGLRVRGLTTLTVQNVSDAFDKMDRKTLGQLLSEVSSKIQLPSDMEQSLGKALDDRNYLFHRFFMEHDVNFASDTGRRQMIDELRKMTRYFREADQLIDEISIPLLEKLGLSQEFIDAEILRMYDEAKRRDTSG